MIRVLFALALAAALAACSAGGPLSATDAAGAPAVRAKGQASPEPYAGPVVAGAAGDPLPLATWPAAAPRAVILGVHGYGDYGALTFSMAGPAWAGAGITTYAYDQRGFGRGETRARWPGAEALVDDLIAVAREIRGRHPCLPLVVVGHSMGGGVTLTAAARGLDADAIVLAAPAIWGGAELNPFHRLAAWLAASVVPERRFTGEGVVRIQASDNIEALRAMARDPYYLRPPSAREIMGLVRVTDLAAEAAAGVRLPALLLLGAKDQIVPARAVERVFARLAGETRTIRYGEGWHLLFRDLQAAAVWRDVTEYALSADRAARYAGPACGTSRPGAARG